MASSALGNENPYLQGNFAPVAEEVTAFDLPVSGQIPSELEGRFLRNGANSMSIDHKTHHEFIGEGMVHGVRLRGGKAEWYRNRWVRGAKVRSALGEPDIGGPVHASDDAPNTHVIDFAGMTLALVESGPLPVALDYELRSTHRVDFGGTLAGSFGPHPKIDPVSGALHVVCYDWERWGDHVQYVEVSPSGFVSRSQDIRYPGPAMVHDMVLTGRYVVLFDFPVLLDPAMATAGHPFPFRWFDNYGARVGLLPRATEGDVRWFEIAPCYAYHAVNAFDSDDGSVVIDVCRYERTFDRFRNGSLGDGLPTLDRWTLNLKTSTVVESRLDDRHQDFPRIHPQRLGRSYRYSYGTLFADGPSLDYGGLIKHDLQSRTSEIHDFGVGRSSSEPAFAMRGDQEDDGWIISYVYDAATDRSEVVILDAQNFSAPPVATIHLPRRVPNGFHGGWYPDHGIA
jgi:carotenoid cleavage dioxygenase-like enzyme